MGSLNQSIPAFIDKVVDFPDGKSYQIIRPLTDFRKCHDGRPLEARIVLMCEQVTPEPLQGSENEFVMKVKVQAPQDEQEPVEGPSTTTAAELKALEKFAQADTPYSPHLLAFKKTVQNSNGMLPGGYVTYMVMTKMPGKDLLAAQFWGKTEQDRNEIVQAFLQALRAIYELGIEPVDCALRNVLWEAETKRCTIIDFELYRSVTETFTNEKKELERWGLARRKPPVSWWAEWQMQRGATVD